MEEGAKEWYYTSGPDQVGPVTFEELKAKAAAAELHPRQDMAWKQSMDEWVPAGQIENLFEKRITESTSEAEASSMSALESNKPHNMGEVDLWPGASRRWFVLLVVLFPIVWLVICMAFASFVGTNLSPGFQKLFLLIGLIVPLWVVVDASLSRLSNLGMNKLWFIIHFVPVANLWLGYRSFACPAGYAKYKKLDPVGWFLAIFYWLSLAACLAMAILIPAVLATTMKDSDFMKKFEKFREQVEAAAEEKADAPKKRKKPAAPAPAP